MPYIQRYLSERKQYLKNMGNGETKALFPSIVGRGTGYYTSNGFRKIKTKIEVVSGVDFKIKDFRSTLTSLTVNGDLNLLPAMSAQLRHRSMKTTQTFYARIEQGAAGKKLANAWMNTPIVGSIDSQKAVIDEKFPMPGYG